MNVFQSYLEALEFGQVQFASYTSDVYKNPKTLRRFKRGCRGVALADGTVYLVDSQYIIHDALVKFLARANILPIQYRNFSYFDDVPGVIRSMKHLLLVECWDDTTLRLTESYGFLAQIESEEGGEKFFELAEMYKQRIKRKTGLTLLIANDLDIPGV